MMHSGIMPKYLEEAFNDPIARAISAAYVEKTLCNLRFNDKITDVNYSASSIGAQLVDAADISFVLPEHVQAVYRRIVKASETAFFNVNILPLAPVGCSVQKFDITNLFTTKNEGISVVVLDKVLHHLDYNDQEQHLSNLATKLVDKQQVILYEVCEPTVADTGDALLHAYRSLPRTLRRNLLVLNDWIHHQVMSGETTPIKGAFRSLDDWQTLAEQCGFNIKERKYLGIKNSKSLLNPQGVLVLTKES